MNSGKNYIYGELHEAVLKELEKVSSPQIMSLWYSKFTVESVTGNKAVLRVENDFFKNILENRMKDNLVSAFSTVLAGDIDVEIISSESYTKGVTVEPDEQESFNSFSAVPISKRPVLDAEQLGFESPHPEYTFDTFVVGTTNDLACSTALAVANSPAKLYNPLYIYGPSGIGKTHLLFAIYNHVKMKFPHFNIVYVSSETFANEIINAIQTNTQFDFREKYRNADMLLLDDIQFFTGKRAVQEELFHTFNTLYEHHKQLIFTSDTAPAELIGIETRLKTRFEWGITTDIQVPNIELRVALFRRKAEDYGMAVPDEVIDYLASMVKTNVRRIEGALKTLKAYSLVKGREITLEFTKASLSDYLSQERQALTFDYILEFICHRYGVPKDAVKGTKRTQDIVGPRHIVCYMVKKLTNATYKNIGKSFDRDHSTIMSSCEMVRRRIENEDDFAREMAEIERLLTEQN